MTYLVDEYNWMEMIHYDLLQGIWLCNLWHSNVLNRVKKLLPMRNYAGWEWFCWTFIDIGTNPHYSQWSGGEWKWPITELLDDTKTSGNYKQQNQMHSFSTTETTNKMHFNICTQLHSYFPNTELHFRKWWPWQES